MTWEATHRRKQAVETVHDVVGAMRAIAAGRIQGAQRALEGARRYHDVVLRGMAAVLGGAAIPSTDPMRRPTTLVVMTSEEPLCGSFTPNVLGYAERRWDELRRSGEARLIVIGQRGIRLAAARGLEVAAGEPAATSVDGLHEVVKRLAMALGKRHPAGDMGNLLVVYNRYGSISEQIPSEMRLLPPDFGAIRGATTARTSPIHRYLTPAQLLDGLVQEYLFISLYLVAVESYASEQASRLVAMDASTRNTQNMLDTLKDQERRERQGEITARVMELIGARFAAEA